MKLSFQNLLLILLIGNLFACKSGPQKLLVFSKTAGFRHASIENGIKAIQKLGTKEGFEVVATEDATYFNELDLQQFQAVIFLNTTGDVLNDVQQSHLERYIQAGGGFVGIHAATDTEYDWAWYNNLVGAQFKDHPAIQEAELEVQDAKHPATQHLGLKWAFKDEWYNFKNRNDDIQVLLKIDETTYEGGNNGDHPMSWYHEYDGGRAFYTGLGHRPETFDDQEFLQHLAGGIQYAIGEGRLDYSKAHTIPVPEENRFVKEVLDFNLNEPMEMDELPGQGILFVERRGALKLYDFAEKKTRKLAQLEVFYGNEDGLLGLAVDPNYEENNWIYLFYSAPGEESIQHISRFDLVGDSLYKDSEKLLVDIPTIRQCCHSGGGLEFGPNGNLFIGVGDNTNPFESNGYAPIDERPGRALWDAQKSAANTNDLRGKVLRITPQDDGTYTIPEGNLFPEGTPNTRPEIYAMGCRNPFRFDIDTKTGYLYWGDVGPDAGKTNPIRGPKGMGEFNQARKAGFWGWPYTRGNNQAYNDYNFTTKVSGEKFNPTSVVNNSPNNTGIQELPPIKESLIWYSYDASEEFKWLGEGGVNPMGGPVFHASDYPKAEATFPEYFENKLFVYEWMRDWIYVVTLDENQDYVRADAFMSNTEFSHPMDMFFGQDGQFYVLEYGQSWNTQNLDARLSRISYIEGNRAPIANIKVDKEVGAAPLTVSFSGKESMDYDRDELKYEWSFDDPSVQSKDKEPQFTFEEAGEYQVRLRVVDPKGEEAISYQKILVGNDPPSLSIQMDKEDPIYWDGKTINYEVVVKDTEDGSTRDNSISAEQVKVTLNYIPEGKDIVMAAIGHQQNTVPKGRQIIDGSDCKACHAIDKKVNGPSYEEIAQKYDKENRDYLISTVIKGGSGVWGETLMSAHPQLSVEEVGEAVDYILSLDADEKDKAGQSLPLKGTLTFTDHIGREGAGQYVLIASYLDQGHPELNNANLSAQQQFVFYPPIIQAEDANEKSDNLSVWDKGSAKLVGSIKHDSYLKFDKIDFKGLQRIQLAADFNKDYHYQGTVEIRVGALDGPLLGSQQVDHLNEEKDIRKTYDISVSSRPETGALYIVFKHPQDADIFTMNADWLLLEYDKPVN